LLKRLWNKSLVGWDQEKHDARVRSTWPRAKKGTEVITVLTPYEAAGLPGWKGPDLSPPDEAREWVLDAVPACFCVSVWRVGEEDWRYHHHVLSSSLRRMKSCALELPREEWAEFLRARELPESVSVHVSDLTDTQVEVVRELLRSPGISSDELCHALGRKPKGLNTPIGVLKDHGLLVSKRGYWLVAVPRQLESS
tara:strand:+ start:105 stop:692 length:588 start_codon:yes stop_codon:yes gene_type:complete